MSNEATVYGSLVGLLRDCHATPRDVVTAETRLHHDLRMDGDDAVAFLNAVCERWDIEWSGFDFGRHFLGEAEVSSPFAWLGRRLFPETRRKVPITVGHLVSVIESGRWCEPNEAAV